MSAILFVTGNQDKFSTALHVCNAYGIEIAQASPHIDEVQAENPEYIVRKKAQTAFEMLKQPVVVSDDSWAITGLRGFPGAYMKSMNEWFSVDDFLRLTGHLEDRSCVLTQYLVYQDGSDQVVFTHQVKGTILRDARGEADVAWTKLVAMDGDGGETIAEIRKTMKDRSNRIAANVWKELLSWYKENRV